jgi:peptidylprolyl isomerase
MSKGEVAKLTLAPEKAYGSGGFPAWGIQPNAALVFEIEIISINGK